MADQNDSSIDQPNIFHGEEDLFEKFGRPALMAGAVLILALTVLVYWWQQKSSRESAALEKFFAAKTAEEYQAVLSKYPGTPACALSLVELAKADAEKQNYSAAISNYNRFLKEFPQHPAAPAVEYARALCHDSSGSKPEAKAAYETIFNARPLHPFAGAAAVALARIYQAENNNAAARQVLADLLARDTTSSRLDEARGLLRELSVTTDKK